MQIHFKLIRGFTLPELLITLAIASVLFLVAVPSYKHFRKYQQEAYITQALDQTISYARLQAVLRYQNVLISPHDNHWQKGWDVTLENHNVLLRRFPEMPLNIKLASRYQNLKIFPNGMTAGYQGHFVYGKDPEIWLIFSPGGKTHVEKKAS